MQAILITAYKDYRELLELAGILSPCFNVYIHLDKKWMLSESDINQLILTHNVKVIRTYTVNWGSFEHLKAILDLCKIGLQDRENSRFHIISGQDYPVGNITKLRDFFEGQGMKEFILSTKVNRNAKSGFDKQALSWVKYYYWYDRIDRSKWFNKIFYRISVAVQAAIGVNKLKQYNIEFDLYQGLVWCSLTRQAVERSVQFAEEQPTFMKFLKSCNAPEEFFFQTVLENDSRLRCNIERNNLRYALYERRDGMCPAVLNEHDYLNIMQSGALFARKTASGLSEGLKRLLKDADGDG